jgi:hypothetical protein
MFMMKQIISIKNTIQSSNKEEEEEKKKNERQVNYYLKEKSRDYFC